MNGTLLESTDYIAGSQSSWLMIESVVDIPILTRKIRCELRGIRNEGTDNDCYFDDVYLRLGSEPECDLSIVDVNDVSNQINLTVYPNPANKLAQILLPSDWGTNIEVRLIDTNGRKIDIEAIIGESKITLYKNSIKAGIYSVILVNGYQSGQTKIVFE